MISIGSKDYLNHLVIELSNAMMKVLWLEGEGFLIE